jgi:hypothetical protein
MSRVLDESVVESKGYRLESNLHLLLGTRSNEINNVAYCAFYFMRVRKSEPVGFWKMRRSNAGMAARK